MTWELICDECGRAIPEGTRHIERNGLVFCNDECEAEYGRVYVQR